MLEGEEVSNDDAQVTGLDDSSIETNSSESEQEPSWFIDDNTPGSGDRPDWLPSKFDKVSDMASSYANLEKKLGDAPESYDFSKAQEWLDPEFEGLQELAELAKSKRVPQEVMDKTLETIGSWFDQFKVDRGAEKEKLGENAQERLQVLNNWAKSNLSKEAYDALKGSMVTAESIKALEEVRGLMLNSEDTVPNGNDSESANQESVQSIENEMKSNWDKYKTDANYRAEIETRLAKAVQNGPQEGIFSEKFGA